jgi:hypothetical protein
MTKTYTIHDAIFELTKDNPTNYSTENNEILEWDIGETKSGATQPTSSEIQNKLTEMQSQANAKETQKATDKASGNQKLLDLGLTQAEATALTGYTPPVAE